MKQYLRDLYRRKDLVLYLVVSNLKAQHKNTFLGYFWWLLDPLLGVLIYYFVVVTIFRRGGDDYGTYLVIGMIIWRWLSATVGGAARAIVGEAGIITQVYLPKIVFPIALTLSGVIQFGFGLVVIAAFLLSSSVRPGSAMLWFPIVALVQTVFTVAMASALAYVCVFLRDIDTLVSHLLRLWFFGSPVIWQPETIPEQYRWLLVVNPISHLLTAYRGMLMDNRRPDLLPLLIIGLGSIAAFLFVIRFYSQHEHRMIKAL